VREREVVAEVRDPAADRDVERDVERDGVRDGVRDEVVRDVVRRPELRGRLDLLVTVCPRRST
jgi:hypothetical protein